MNIFYIMNYAKQLEYAHHVQDQISTFPIMQRLCNKNETIYPFPENLHLQKEFPLVLHSILLPVIYSRHARESLLCQAKQNNLKSDWLPVFH